MATVTVWCNLPLGFVMELVEKSPHEYLPAPRGKTLQIAGANSLRVKGTNPMVLPFASTEVDEAFAREWFKRNAKLPFVENGNAYIQDAAKGAGAGMAKDRKDVKTGLEPLDPENLVAGVSADKEHYERLRSSTL